MVGRKCLPVGYQPRMGISGGPALNYFLHDSKGRAGTATHTSYRWMSYIYTYVYCTCIHMYTQHTRAIAVYICIYVYFTYIHMYAQQTRAIAIYICIYVYCTYIHMYTQHTRAIAVYICIYVYCTYIHMCWEGVCVCDIIHMRWLQLVGSLKT